MGNNDSPAEKTGGQVVSLREFIERIMNERQKALDDALVLREKTLEAHLHRLNEAHAQAIKDREQFVLKATDEPKHEELQRRLSAMELFQAKLVGVGVVLALLAGSVGALIARLWR